MSGLLLNRVKQATTTVGTGTVSLNGAAASAFRTWATGATTTRRYTYLLEEGSDWELGWGIYTSGSPGTLTRNLIASSTGSLLVLAGSAQVSCVMLAEHLNGLPNCTVLYRSATQSIVNGSETAISWDNAQSDIHGTISLPSSTINAPAWANWAEVTAFFPGYTAAPTSYAFMRINVGGFSVQERNAAVSNTEFMMTSGILPTFGVSSVTVAVAHGTTSARTMAAGARCVVKWYA